MEARMSISWTARAARHGCVALLASLVLLAPCARPCTIAVISGKATADGRPLLWKNRDVTNQDNVVSFSTGKVHDYLGLADAGVTAKIFAGLNAAGLAVVNAVSNDLEGTSDSDNGIIIKRILEECATVDEVEALLAATNASGRKTEANFGIIDAFGGGAIFETGNRSYVRYDAGSAPGGFLVRTNYAFSGADPGSGEGFIRFDRASAILGPAAAARSLGVRFLFDRAARDLVNEDVDPYPLPFTGTQNGHPPAYLHTNYSINRYKTASAVVFQGAASGEDPLLATMWCLLGEPVFGIALPLWVRAGSTPFEFRGTYFSPLRQAVKSRESAGYTDPSSEQYLDSRILANGRGGGLAVFISRLESLIFETAETAVNSWRGTPPSASVVRSVQEQIAFWAYRKYAAGSLAR
jgi:hypothetical protein